MTRIGLWLGGVALAGLLGAFGACDSSVGGSGGGSGTSCADFVNEPGAVPVTFTLSNDTGGDIWLVLPNDCRTGDFELSDATGTALTQPSPGCSCEAEQTDDFACTYTCDGPEYFVTYIPAGASHDMPWSGNVARSEAMPQSCYADQVNTHQSCSRVVPAEAGTHSVQIEVFAGLTNCTEGDGVPFDCTCVPSGAGSCSMQLFGLDFASQRTVSADFEVPGDANVTIDAN